MKISPFLFILPTVLALACAPVAQAADTTTDSAAAQSSKHHTFHGVIMAIDAAANTMTVKTSHGEMTLTLGGDTKFRGGKGSLSDYKVGDKVSGSFMMEDGKMMVVTVKPYNSKA